MTLSCPVSPLWLTAPIPGVQILELQDYIYYSKSWVNKNQCRNHTVK